MRKHTKAQRSLRLVHRAGRADPDVHRRRRLLRRAEEEGRCAAAPTHSHQEVRDAIREQQLLTIADVYAAPGLAHAQRLRDLPPGAQLLPDLAPGRKEAKDDPQIALHQRARHANIQKDGTYSVIPRMWGGETTPAELRRIADVGRQVQDPDGQGHRRPAHRPARREEGRPAGVWKDLGMPSGHAYAKALRTVKTCVGSEWCRFGTQDSTQMGKDLERALWRMYAPHKVKLAVSRLPAQLRRVRHQGRRRDRRRLGLGDLRRAATAASRPRSRSSSCKVKTPRGSARVRRRLPAALPRGRLVPRAHGALRRARRPRPREEAILEDARRPQGAVGAAAVRARRRARSVVRARRRRGRHAPVHAAGRVCSRP